ANVNVEIAKASNVLRIPNSALRYRPSNEVFAALGQTPPEPQGRGPGGGGRRAEQPSAAAGATAPGGAVGASTQGTPAPRPNVPSTTQPSGTAASVPARQRYDAPAAVAGSGRSGAEGSVPPQAGDDQAGAERRRRFEE